MWGANAVIFRANETDAYLFYSRAPGIVIKFNYFINYPIKTFHSAYE